MTSVKQSLSFILKHTEVKMLTVVTPGRVLKLLISLHVNLSLNPLLFPKSSFMNMLNFYSRK